MPHSSESQSVGDVREAPPFDVGAMKLAKVYAQAIVEAADKRNCRREVIAELRGVVRDVLATVPGAAAVLGSPRMPGEEKERLIDRLFAASVTPTTLHALQVVARHGRLDILPEIATAVERLADELEGRRQARFTTAVPLDADDRAAIQSEFERQLGGSLAATFHVDPGILGGLVARIDDTIYDHSVATGLVRLGDKLKQRSIHEIQHRRDRLGTA